MSGYKGVWVELPPPPRRSRIRAQIKGDGRCIRLGTFSSLFSAAWAYNVAALKYHGEFACLNDLTRDPDFIGPTLPPLREELPLQLSIK